MEEKDTQDKQDRERLLKRFKDRKPLDDNADSVIMAPPDVREAMSKRDEIADVLKEAFNDEDNNISRKYCLNVADSIIALDKPTGVEKVTKIYGSPNGIGNELYKEIVTELTPDELCEWARKAILVITKFTESKLLTGESLESINNLLALPDGSPDGSRLRAREENDERRSR